MGSPAVFLGLRCARSPRPNVVRRRRRRSRGAAFADGFVARRAAPVSWCRGAPRTGGARRRGEEQGGIRNSPPRTRLRRLAKRRILARHVVSPAVGDPELPWDNRHSCQFDGDHWPCDDIFDLASPHAHHPDFPRRA
ncbi:DUF6221 family protein [Streptomyces sp. NBC_01537]|uniref:DUF6221 family protein n=1 Tax=Streptomyces sp. NBC_01537 TaxID=2903896 RepID=UPI0038631472